MNLVTGATGIVGIRLVYDLIKKGEKVRAVRRAGSDMDFVWKVLNFYGINENQFRAIAWVEADLSDIYSLDEALAGVETVYHAAALVSYQQKDASKLLRINSEGTANLVNACLSQGVKNLCHISSVSALGVEKNGLTSEQTEWKRNQNRSVYGLSKYLAEQEVWRGGAEGMNVAVMSPSVVLGPSKPDQSSGMLIELISKGVRYYPSGGIGVVDVRDVSDACLSTMDKGLFGEKFLLNAENLSYREFLRKAARTFEYPPPEKKLPDWTLELGWRVASLLRHMGSDKMKVTKETARSAKRKLAYDNSKAEKILGKNFITCEASLRHVKSFLSFRLS